MKISTIVVGLGKIGMLYNFNKKRHFNNHCDAIKYHEKYKLVAGVDINEKKRKKFFNKYKVPVFSNLKSAYALCKPKLVIISTPTHKNEKLFQYIKKYKIVPKIFLIEKPGSYNYLSLQKFVNFCKEERIRLIVNYQRSFSNSPTIINKFLKFGKINKIYVFYRKGFYNSCSHYINLLMESIKSKNQKIIHVTSYKKFGKDFIANCRIKIKYLIELNYKKNSEEKIIFENTKGNQMTFLTEKSKILIKKDKRKKFVANNINKNLKNVLNKIANESIKKENINLINNKKTLKIICNIKKTNF